MPVSEPCGATHTIPGGTTLVCTLPLPHAVHGCAVDGMPPYARWPVPWTAEDEARLAERHTWRKGHVRRAYQTLGMWKAERGL